MCGPLLDRREEAVPYVSLPECKSDEAGHVGGEVDELRVPTPSFPPPSPSSSSLFPPPCSEAFAFVLEFSITHKQAHTTSLCVSVPLLIRRNFCYTVRPKMVESECVRNEFYFAELLTKVLPCFARLRCN